MKCNLKYFKRANIYKNSTGSCTVMFGSEEDNSVRAHSYNWWCFVKRINGVLIFNSYSYSVSTTAHQSAVRSLLSQKGVKIDLFIESPEGLDNLESALRYYVNKIEANYEYLKKKGIRATTREKLRNEIDSYRYSMRRIFEVSEGKADNLGSGTIGTFQWLSDYEELKAISKEV